MSEFNKYSTDGGATFIDVEDRNAVHYGDQSKGYVGKNELLNEAINQTLVTVNVVVNSDKSVTLNGTPTGGNFALKIGSINGDSKSHKISKCPVGASNDTYLFQFKKDGSWTNDVVYDTDINYTFESGHVYDMYLVVRQNVTVSNLTFYPMIRLASVSDSTYEPYLTPNTDLMSYADNAILGAHNLLPNYAKSDTVYTIPFTVNSDKTIEFVGTATGGNARFSWVVDKTYKAGTYILGEVKYNSNPTESVGNFAILDSSANATILAFNADKNKHITFTFSEDTFIHEAAIYIPSGKSVDIKLSPMLRLVSDTVETYGTYTMTNEELTAMTTVEISGCQSNGQISAYKKNGMVTFSFAGSSVFNTDGITLGTVPDSFKPIFAQAFPTKVYNGSTYVDAQIHINTSGLVRLQSLFGQKIEGAIPENIKNIPPYMTNRP